MDGRILRAVKILAVALMGSGSVEDLTEETIAEALENLAENYERPADGEKGDTGATGAHVTAMALTVDGGVVTGGTATLSDSTTVTITVTSGT